MEYQLFFFFSSQDASIRTIGIDLALKLDSEGTALGCTIPEILKLCASSQNFEKMLGYRHLGTLDTDGKTDLALIPKNTIIKVRIPEILGTLLGKFQGRGQSYKVSSLETNSNS